jgi:hypothetical protein
MAALPPRLCWHTVLAVVLLASGVVGPLLLLFQKQLGMAVTVPGLTLTAVGAASLLGASVSRFFDRGGCSALQRCSMLASVWALNPVFIVVLSLATGWVELAWWSGLPLAAVLTLLSGRMRLVEGDPDWTQEGSLHCWFFSRLVFIGLPMCLLSFQVALYLPQDGMLPQGPAIGLFVCGICVLISGKFCAMCACLAMQRLPQALLIMILLSADWISSLHLMEFIKEDRVKTTLLLCHLLAAGLVQLRASLVRLALRPRWSRALAQRRIRDVSLTGEVDTELGTRMTHPNQQQPGSQLESSDSEDERGPGSLPDGFHDTLAVMLGLPPANSQNARQFLCGVRRATLRNEEGKNSEAGSVTTAASANGAATAPLGNELPCSSGGSGIGITEAGVPLESMGAGVDISVAALELLPDERVCTVCQEEIAIGDRVRPMPKCTHVFHAACLERWARTMREATRCPTCRRPALMRKQLEGSTPISVFANRTEDSSQGSGQTSTGSTVAVRSTRPMVRPTPSLGARPPQSGTETGATRAVGRASGISSLRQSLGITEALAEAALDCAGGDPDIAAHVVLEHRALLAASFSNGPRLLTPESPPGVVAAIIQANPDLAGMQLQLRRQLMSLYSSGQLRPVSWADLPSAGRVEVLRLLLEDVVRRLEGDRS